MSGLIGKAMKRSVVVATWQRAPLLRGCLDALDAQTTPVDEVIVVGRSDDPDARRLVDAFEGRTRPRWVDVSEPGHLPPIIRGLAEATGDIVAFVDDDAEPETTWLDALTEPFKDDNVACVGGRSTGPGGVPDEVDANEAGRVSWYGRFSGRFGALPSQDPVPADGILEGNSAWRRADPPRSELHAVVPRLRQSPLRDGSVPAGESDWLPDPLRARGSGVPSPGPPSRNRGS